MAGAIEVRLTLRPQPGLAGESSKSLGNRLIECVQVEPDLEGRWGRVEVETAEGTLGGVWEGTVAVLLKNRDHLVALARSVVAGLKGLGGRPRRVEVEVVCGDRRATLKVDEFKDLDDVAPLVGALEQLSRSIANLPDGPSPRGRSAGRS